MTEAVPASALKDFLAVTFYLLGGLGSAAGLALAIRSLLRKPSPFPQPMLVELAKEFTPLDRTERFEIEVRDGFRDVNDKLVKADAERRQSVSRCYQNTERLVGDMRDEIRATQQDLGKQLRETNDGLNGRINDILGAVRHLSGAFEQSQKGHNRD